MVPTPPSPTNAKTILSYRTTLKQGASNLYRRRLTFISSKNNNQKNKILWIFKQTKVKN